MMDDVPSESNRVRRLLRERFTFQISVDTSNVPQGLGVAEAALKAGVTVLELGTPLLKYEGVRNVVPIFRQRFPKALLLADMKTMDGGEGRGECSLQRRRQRHRLPRLGRRGDGQGGVCSARHVPAGRSGDPEACLR